MKKQIKSYLITWGFVVAIFNIMVFLLPKSIFEQNPDNFWVVYIALTIGLIGQAICSLLYAGKEKKEERFLNLPVVIIGYIALMMYSLLALESVALQFLPTWFTIIVAIVVFAYYALSVMQTIAAAKIVMEIDEKVERKTNYMYTLITESKTLAQIAPTQMRAVTKKVYESFRYSDPMSAIETEEVEQIIRKEYKIFAEAVKNSRRSEAELGAKKIIQLVNERNEICKRCKR